MTEVDDSESRERLSALLQAQHSFPGPYAFKVIFRNEPGRAEALVEAVCSATKLEEPQQPPTLRSSAGARFVSMSLELQVGNVEDVLAVYDVLSGRDDIISYF